MKNILVIQINKDYENIQNSADINCCKILTANNFKDSHEILLKNYIDLIITDLTSLKIIEELNKEIKEKDIAIFVLSCVKDQNKLKDAFAFISDKDSLTNLASRKEFDREFKKIFSLSREEKSLFSLIIIDIDNFKQINDLKGHLMGDEVLKHTAQTLKNSTRRIDYLARIGGDEFVIILQNTDLLTAFKIAERIRNNLAQNLNITASLGAASIEPSDIDSSCIFKRADQALYTAKKNGKNKVITEPFLELTLLLES